jgi:hypothetical protein
MEELLTLKPDDLRSVRLANDLEKRSSAWPYGWGTRFTVLSANFIYVYGTKNVRASPRAAARRRAPPRAAARAPDPSLSLVFLPSSARLSPLFLSFSLSLSRARRCRTPSRSASSAWTT